MLSYYYHTFCNINYKTIDTQKVFERNLNVTLKWGSTKFNGDSYFWEQPYDNQDELMASCADEWFKFQPNTIFEDFLRSEHQTFKQDFSQSRKAENLEVKAIDNKIMNTNRIENNASSINLDSLDYSDKANSEIFSIKDEMVIQNISNIQNNEKNNEEKQKEQPIVEGNDLEFDKSHLVNKDLNNDTQNKRKRNKILTLNESRRKLSLRADVMNKNFFRALRREIKFIFDEYLISHGFSTSKCKRTFKSNLKRYTAHILDNSSLNQTEENFNPDTFQKILGVFLNTCSAKKILSEDSDYDKIEDFNSLLYSYSHQKFYSYIAIPEVKFIIDIVFKEISVGDFIQKHRALSQNRDSYNEHINSILALHGAL